MFNTTSFRTTALGILTIAGGLIANIGMPLLDNDPTTGMNIPALFIAFTAGWGLIQARDHKTTSEDAGIK